MSEVLPFDREFQRKLIKLAALDDGFLTQALRHVQPEMFESESLRWAWKVMQREREENRTPTMLVLRDRIRDVEKVAQPQRHALVERIDQELLREEGYLRHRLGEFARRNIFVQGWNESQRLFHMGRVDEAIDLMQAASQKANQVTFDAPQRTWFFEGLTDRDRRRRDYAKREWEFTYATGIHDVDLILDGGLSLGELGVWMADSKGGKSLLLIHLAVYAARSLRIPVLVIILEGSMAQTEDRLEAAISKVLYSKVKRGQMDPEIYGQLQEEYRGLRRLLVVRAMTENWSYNAGDIRSELDELKSMHGWVPKMLDVDYGDLLRSQEKARSEEEHQRNAFGALKTLTQQDRGYAIWTATQAKRPYMAPDERKKLDKRKKDTDESEWWKMAPVLRAKDVADSYNKIRRADFIGSINQTMTQRKEGEAILYADLYRDNLAGRRIRIKQDLTKIQMVDLLHPWNRPDSPEGLRPTEGPASPLAELPPGVPPPPEQQELPS